MPVPMAKGIVLGFFAAIARVDANTAELLVGAARTTRGPEEPAVA